MRTDHPCEACGYEHARFRATVRRWLCTMCHFGQPVDPPVSQLVTTDGVGNPD